MNCERLIEEDIRDSENKLVEWIKEHKVQLMFAGISITTLITMVLGLKNKEAITKLWNLLKQDIEKGSLYSDKWFNNASLEELKSARECVRIDYLNSKLDMDYRIKCWDLLAKFDNFIGERNWAGKKYEYPFHSEHGWYLLRDD